MKMNRKMIFFSFFQLRALRWNEIDRGKPNFSGETCTSATLSTTNPTWTGPASNRLSHGTAYFRFYFTVYVYNGKKIAF
jgi:hypothetical protein